MKYKELKLATGIFGLLAGGVQAENHDMQSKTTDSVRELLAEGKESKGHNAKIQRLIDETNRNKDALELDTKKSGEANNFDFDIKGAKDYIQAGASYIHQNLGLGVQLSHTDNVDQLVITGGIQLTPQESSALSRVVENGIIKVSLVESEVKNALANFDETGYGLELVANLKNAFFKQVSLAHSKHNLDITDGSDKWWVTGTTTNTAVNNQNTDSQTIQTTTTTTTTYETRNKAEDVDQTAIKVLLGLTQDLDVVLGYARDSLGKSLSSAELEYRLNPSWSIKAGYAETRRFSGDEEQEIKTATLNYNKGNWSAFAGIRDNGIDSSPYAGVQYSLQFGGGDKSTNKKKNNKNIGSSLTSPVVGITEIHPHAISQETRETTNIETSEVVDNHASGLLSNVRSTDHSCSVDFNVSDKDGVQEVIIQLSNGSEKQLSQTSGAVTFDRLSDNTSYGLKLYGITKNPITGGWVNNLLGKANCKTKKEKQAPGAENPTKVSDISGSSKIKVGETPKYSITATDKDHGIASVTAKVNGDDISVSNGGDIYSIVLSQSATSSAGTINIQFYTVGTMENGQKDKTIIKLKRVAVEQEISSPSINPIGTVNIDDNGGVLPSQVARITGSGILPDAVFSILQGARGLSINSSTGEMIFDADVNGNQSYSITVQVVNLDDGRATESFILNVTDNG